MTSPSSHLPSPTRRDALKAGAALGGSVGLAGSFARFAHAAGSDEMRLALIGCGGRGTGAAVNALSSPGRFKITALADAFESRLSGCLRILQRKFPQQVDVPPERRFVGLDAFQKALATDVDMVAICTPPGFRPQQFEAAVAAGKHIFMEKPLAVDAPGVRQVAAANVKAKEQGLLVAVGHHLRHEAKHIELIDLIHNGAIGEVGLIRVYFNAGSLWIRPRQQSQTETEYQVSNWYYFNWLSGDHIVEQHVHDLDVGNWVMRDEHPVEAQGSGGRQVRIGRDTGEIFDHHAVEFTYPSGVKMISNCRQIRGCWTSFAQHVHGVRGTADMQGHNNTSLTIAGKEPRVWRREKDGHQTEWDNLCAALAKGEKYNEVDHTLRSTMTAILGRMATYSGKVVTWDEALSSNLDLAPEILSYDHEPPVRPEPNGIYACAIPGQTKAV